MREKRSGSTQTALFNAAEAKDNNIIGKKLQEERRTMRLSLDDVSAKLETYGISVKKSAVSKWENGVTIPNAYQMLAICAAFGVDDSVSYFSGNQTLNQEGRRKVSEYREDLISTGKYTPEPVAKKIIYIQMPVSYLSASAGTGDFLDEENFEMMSFPESAVPDGADFAVKVHGDSMEPVYSNGQTVWVKKCSELNPGDVGIFTLDGNGYIKMYDEHEPEDVDQYTDCDGVMHMQPVLVSYNDKYSPIVVTSDQRLEIVGKVL